MSFRTAAEISGNRDASIGNMVKGGMTNHKIGFLQLKNSRSKEPVCQLAAVGSEIETGGSLILPRLS